jgi:hypothetical protein
MADFQLLDIGNEKIVAVVFGEVSHLTKFLCTVVETIIDIFG